jgi:hypothetical protein
MVGLNQILATEVSIPSSRVETILLCLYLFPLHFITHIRSLSWRTAHIFPFSYVCILRFTAHDINDDLHMTKRTTGRYHDHDMASRISIVSKNTSKESHFWRYCTTVSHSFTQPLRPVSLHNESTKSSTTRPQYNCRVVSAPVAERRSVTPRAVCSFMHLADSWPCASGRRHIELLNVAGRRGCFDVASRVSWYH